MGILIVEFVTGGGEYLLAEGDPWAAELVAEGQAMRDSVATALRSASDEPLIVFQAANQAPCSIAGVENRIIRHAKDFWRQLEQICTASSQPSSSQPSSSQPSSSQPSSSQPSSSQSSSSQSSSLQPAESWRVLVIAPETEGWLSHLTRKIESSRASLLSPDSQFVELCSDKTATIEWLMQRGVPVPATHCSPDRGWMIKPRIGCGGEGVRCVREADLATMQAFSRERWHLEPRGEGLPVSISCLRCQSGFVLLPPFEQRFSSVDPWRYAGGMALSSPDLIRRCQRLARKTVSNLPPTCGYFGIDLLLGPSSATDVVLEVNPRLTTSWVGLSKLLGGSLGKALLDLGRGKLPSLSFDPRGSSVEFSLDAGKVEMARGAGER